MTLGTIPVPAVSDRTPQVRDAILGAVRLDSPAISNYASITVYHLARITQLSLNGTNINSLKADDFDGLNSLTTLSLTNNQLTTLPEGIFDGLIALTFLSLGYNRFTMLPEGIFDGLNSLTTLSLRNNQLTTLPEDIFDGLTALTTLLLFDNRLTTLPEGIFDNLTALTRFESYRNQLTTLPEGIFDNLTALTTLDLRFNRFTMLPAGIFDGLSPLTTLWLYGNAVNPLPLTVSLEKVETDQIKAVAPTGAPFDIILPLRVTNGSIYGGANTITIPVGSRESETLTVTRTPGTTAAVTSDIGDPLPNLPSGHGGYALVKSADLPLEVVDDATAAQATTDFNGDGKTDFVDFFLFADAYGTTDAGFDLDGSGTVDFVDFFQFVDAFGQSGQAKLLAMAQEMLGLPAETQLQQNAPNPFNSETVISWFLLKPGPAQLEVFALNGQRLAVLHQGPLQAGYHRIHWDGRDDAGRPLASGVYLYRLVSPGGVLTRKLTLLK